MMYELRSIDAWGNNEDGWEWNASYNLESNIHISDEATTEEVLDLMLRMVFQFPEKARTEVTMYDDGDIYELQLNSTGEPLYALVPQE